MNILFMQRNTALNLVAGNMPNVIINMPEPVASAYIQRTSAHLQQGPTPDAPQQTQFEKMDYISKVKVLMGALKVTVPMTLNSAAQILHQNCNSVSSPQKSSEDSDLATITFDNNLDEFYSLCNQMELHLRSVLACVEQSQAAARYIPFNVNPSQLAPPPTKHTLSYTAYVKTARAQVQETRKMRSLLAMAARRSTTRE